MGMEDTNHGYVKALSVNNIANMVYAQQVFHEWGMPEGLHLAAMPDGVLAIPDKGWIVWFASEHTTESTEKTFYEALTDNEFRNRFVLYDDMPELQKQICDAHPSYDEWVTMMDAAFDAKKDGE